MPNHRRTTDPFAESEAKLRLFADTETMGDLAAVDPDPDLESVDDVDAVDPRWAWLE